MELLVAVDFSDSTEKVIENVIKIALSSDSKIWLINVAKPDPDFVGYEVGPQSVRDDIAQRLRTEHKILQQYSKKIREEGIACVALLVQGATIDTIII